jgi:hypothetical protein
MLCAVQLFYHMLEPNLFLPTVLGEHIQGLEPFNEVTAVENVPAAVAAAAEVVHQFDSAPAS